MRKAFLIILAALFVIGAASAAQAGSIVGFVVDAQGIPVNGARVSLHTDGVCLELTASTNAIGWYRFDDVSEGVYMVRASKMEVGTGTVEGVSVLDGGETEVAIIMLTGGPRGPQTLR